MPRLGTLERCPHRYRFGGKGNPKSSTWQAAGFPSSDGVPGSKIPKHDGGLTRLSEDGSWQPEATLKRSQVLQEKVEDELTKQEYYLLGERSAAAHAHPLSHLSVRAAV